MLSLPCSECQLIRDLKREVERLREECRSKDGMIRSLQEEVKVLTFRVNMDSTTSSKPPHTDGPKGTKPQSEREKSDRKRGGQPGHKGHTIKLPHEPDIIVDHLPQCCIGCKNRDRCQEEGAIKCKESRYVVEAITLTKVIEHRCMVADCPNHTESPVDDSQTIGSFPDNVTAHIQYGNSFRVITTLLSTMGAMSVSRISELMRSMFGITLSPGTIVSMVKESSKKVSPALDEIRERILQEPVVHSDETGTRVDGITNWVHEVCTKTLTLLKICSKRGSKGMDEMGIIPELFSILVHDCWSPYFKYDNVEHALCNAHILRELKGIHKLEPDHEWPVRMGNLLRMMKIVTEEARDAGMDALDRILLTELTEVYDEIMELAEEEYVPPEPPIEPKRGRKKLGKEGALIQRLLSYKGGFLMFLYDFRVPFDNNQAERDFRNVKTKTKVAGSFRSITGAQSYLDVMSFLITARKNGVGMFQALDLAYSGKSTLIFRQTS